MARRKIILYNPKAVFYTMPLGLMAVGSALDPARYDVQIVDGRLLDNPLQTLLPLLDDALCLGVTTLTGDPIRDALKVTRAAKAYRPDLPIIWGGWHASLFPEQTLQEPCIDATVQAQGELTFAAMLERLQVGQWFDGVPGCTTRVDGRIVRNPPRPMTPMNQLPPVNYDLINVPQYFQLKRDRQLDYISSTGCFFRCAFCADPFVFGRKWSGIEPTRIADELEGLWHRHHFHDVAFQDETFFTYNDRVIEMAEEFLRRGLKFTWTATMRADQGSRLSEEALQLCIRAGLRWLMIGVEAGSQQMLDHLKKDVKIEQIVELAQRCARHGVKGVFPHIVGFPGESDASIQATLNMATKLRRMHSSFETPVFYFKPYPGSLITDQATAAGYRLPDSLEEWANFDFVAGASGPWVSTQQYQMVERFKFYNRMAGGRKSPIKWPLQQLARWRLRQQNFRFPIEQKIIERIKPLPKMS
ncbi:MAG: B12-binding domain-containing radical SAM protein [Chlorobi bacterium]|nr:B12-binding domain-containing radical SAM protein [Chlorobiota bacterium]